MGSGWYVLLQQVPMRQSEFFVQVLMGEHTPDVASPATNATHAAKTNKQSTPRFIVLSNGRELCAAAAAAAQRR